jgi:hypothetical protein
MRTYVSASIFGLLSAPPIAETKVFTKEPDDWPRTTVEDIGTSESEPLAAYEKLATKTQLVCIYDQLRRITCCHVRPSRS